MKNCSFVYGCGVFGSRPSGTESDKLCITAPEIPSNCPYCYAKEKFGNKPLMPKNFNEAIYYRDKLILALSQKSPEIFVGSIMGDFLTPEHITNDDLVDIFTIIESRPKHLVMLLSKNPGRYVDFVKNVWKKELPVNAWCGTSIENNYYKRRADYLRELKSLSPNTHIWVECEPILGMCDMVDFTSIDHVNVSGLGGDQIYTGQNGNRFSSYFSEDWVISLFKNESLNNKKISMWEGLSSKCKSEIIKSHVSHEMYEELHKQNGSFNRKDENDIFKPMW